MENEEPPKIETVKKKERGRKPKSPSEKPHKRIKAELLPSLPSEKSPIRAKLGLPHRNE